MGQSEVAHAFISSHRDLGESSSMSNELEKMRMEQMMMQQQQMCRPQPQMTQQPQMMQQSPDVSGEHAELLAMKKQMAEMQRQNVPFRDMLAKQATMTAGPQHYTQDDLAKFFQTKKAAAKNALRNELVVERQKLDSLVDKMSAPTIPGAQMLVEIDEGSEADDAKTEMPLY